MRLVVGTKNKKKLIELATMLGANGFDVVGIDDICPGLDAPDETGDTFKANAELKALYFAEHSGELCLADDSGLEVDALGGAPGVYSARYAGEPSDDGKNNAKLMAEMSDVADADRGGQFHCVIAVAVPSRVLLTTEGIVRGEILRVPRGERGFGYDPYFFYPPLGRAFAELSITEKEGISHRGRALRALKERLPELKNALNEKDRGRR